MKILTNIKTWIKSLFLIKQTPKIVSNVYIKPVDL